MDDLSRFCCQNKDCADYGKRGHGNLSVCARYGKKKHLRLLYCRRCKARFSERKGTALFHAHLDTDKIVSVLAHIQEAVGCAPRRVLWGWIRRRLCAIATWKAITPSRFMTNWWLFPPQTREGQFDEKWAFVGKKEKHCDPDDPADAALGDSWDHVAFDPEHRLVLSVVPGKRCVENVKAVVDEFQRRTDDAAIILLTSDEYPAYKEAIHNAYGKEVIPPRTGKAGRPRKPYILPPEDINYAMVHKTRKNGRVVAVEYRIVFGTEERVELALETSAVSKKVNTAFLERENGTDRHRNARKSRKSYCFSKDGNVHDAVTYFTMYSYNFCWPVRTLRLKDVEGNYHDRTPAMAAGLTDHVWSLREWLTLPAMQ